MTRLVALATSLAVVCGSLPALALDKEQCVAASESGQKLRTQKKLRAARKELISCAQDECPGVVKQDCTKWLAEIDEALPSVVITAKDGSGNDLSDVRVSIDGELVAEKLTGSAMPVDPGMHTFRFEASGNDPVESKILIREAERNRPLTVTIGKPPPAPTPPPVAPSKPVEPTKSSSSIPTAAWVFGAVGLVSLGGFAYFGLSGRSDLAHLRDTCAPYCNKADENPARTKFVLADVSLGVSVVSLGLATVFILTHKDEPLRTEKSEAKASALRVDVVPLASGGAAVFAGSF